MKHRARIQPDESLNTLHAIENASQNFHMVTKCLGGEVSVLFELECHRLKANVSRSELSYLVDI